MRSMQTMLAAVLLFMPLASALAGTPVIDERQQSQEARIDQGVASGELTGREARRLEAQQTHIDRMENRAKADGVVTGRERARIHTAQDNASARIARNKHDRHRRD